MVSRDSLRSIACICEGENLRYLPLSERKHRLRGIVPQTRERLVNCDHVEVQARRYSASTRQCFVLKIRNRNYSHGTAVKNCLTASAASIQTTAGGKDVPSCVRASQPKILASGIVNGARIALAPQLPSLYFAQVRQSSTKSFRWEKYTLRSVQHAERSFNACRFRNG